MTRSEHDAFYQRGFQDGCARLGGLTNDLIVGAIEPCPPYRDAAERGVIANRVTAQLLGLRGSA
jgi:hypothetical protein